MGGEELAVLSGGALEVAGLLQSHSSTEGGILGGRRQRQDQDSGHDGQAKERLRRHDARIIAHEDHG